MTDGAPLRTLAFALPGKGKGRAEEPSRVKRKRAAVELAGDEGGEGEDRATLVGPGQVTGVYKWPAKISRTSRVIKNTSSATRDHLAVERTYLSWLRLSTALSTISGALLIHFHFSSRPTPELEANYSRPMGVIFFVLSLVVLASGTVTFFKTQNGYIRSIGFVEVGKVGSAVAVVTAMAIAVTTILLLVTEKGVKGEVVQIYRKKLHAAICPQSSL